MMKPLILITNDDGVYSPPGLIEVEEAVQHLGDLFIVALLSQQTSMWSSFPRNKDIGIIEKIT